MVDGDKVGLRRPLHIGNSGLLRCIDPLVENALPLRRGDRGWGHTSSVAQRVCSTRFVGRRDELARLQRGLGDGEADALPALYFLAGESGVGKTRLLRELIDRAEASGAQALGGACIELGEDELPYAPLVAALRPLQRAGDPALEGLSESTRSQLARLNPALGEPSTEGEGERGEAQRRLFDAFLELISALGESRPVLLWIEDVHWADRSTRSFLRFLAASLSEENVAVIATYRADELHRRHPLRPLLADLDRPDRAERIELERFDRSELADQLEDILGEAPGQTTVERLFGRSEGNPLYTEELLAAGDDGRGSLPPSLREALLLRAERLSDSCRSLLRLLAVAGRASERLLLEAGGESIGGAAAVPIALREAIDAQIVVIEGERFDFRHALLREVLYDDLLPGERAALHLELAQAFERAEPGPDETWAVAAVAHHYYAAGDQPRALSSALEAADAVCGLHAYGEAGALLDRAMTLWPRVAAAERPADLDEPALLDRAARVHFLAGDDGVAEGLYRQSAEALETCPGGVDPERLAATLTALAACQWSMGRAELSRETQARGLELVPADSDSDSPTRARLLAQRTRFLLLQGRFRAVRECAPEAIELTERLGLDSERSGLLNRYGCALFALGEQQQGRRRMKESIELAERIAISDDLATAYLNFADALHIGGFGEEARSVAEHGISRVTEQISRREGGSTRSIRFMRFTLAEIYFDLGDWESCEEQLLTADSRAGGQGIARAHGCLRYAQLALAQGREEHVEAALEEAAVLLADALEPQYLSVLAALQAEAAGRRGDFEAARTAVDRGIDRMLYCTDDGRQVARAALAGVSVETEMAVRACDLDRHEDFAAARSRAQRLAAIVEAAAEEHDGPVERARLADSRAELARAMGEDDPALWEQAAARWAGLGRPYPEAVARWRGAQAALERGNRAGAQAELERAASLAGDLGAGWLAGEVAGLATRARLELCEEDPTPSAGPESSELPFGLTPREHQVLELVSSGATNREIGEKLFMAEKTASVHVSRILAKLDVRSRTEAAAVAHRHGIGAALR